MFNGIFASILENLVAENDLAIRVAARRSAFLGLYTLVLLPLAAASAQSDDRRLSSAIAGTIRDSMNRPIEFATVRTVGRNLAAVTDDSGRFHIAGIRAGLTRIEVTRIGYRPLMFETTLLPESTVVVSIRLRAVPTLAAVGVAAERASRLARTGFYYRARSGLGTHLVPERIDSLRHLGLPSRLLRDVRGIELRCAAGKCQISTRMPGCLWLFIDGVYHGITQDDRSQMDELVPVEQVYAIEVFERPAIVPTEFHGPTPPRRGALAARAGCGAIAVWTTGRAGH